MKSLVFLSIAAAAVFGAMTSVDLAKKGDGNAAALFMGFTASLQRPASAPSAQSSTRRDHDPCPFQQPNAPVRAQRPDPSTQGTLFLDRRGARNGRVLASNVRRLIPSSLG